MHYFSSKPSKTSHLKHKNSDKRAKFSDKWSRGGGGALRPQPPNGFGPVFTWPKIRQMKSKLRKCRQGIAIFKNSSAEGGAQRIFEGLLPPTKLPQSRHSCISPLAMYGNIINFGLSLSFHLWGTNSSTKSIRGFFYAVGSYCIRILFERILERLCLCGYLYVIFIRYLLILFILHL